jgi:uncharacterized repeat protein (TIGR04076 family)
LAQDPGIGWKLVATVVEARGTCSAGHKAGDVFEISCHDTGGLCGYFYHDLFPALQMFQFGGSLPWWEGDTILVKCPDPDNIVTLRLTRTRRG